MSPQRSIPASKRSQSGGSKHIRCATISSFRCCESWICGCDREPRCCHATVAGGNSMMSRSGRPLQSESAQSILLIFFAQLAVGEWDGLRKGSQLLHLEPLAVNQKRIGSPFTRLLAADIGRNRNSKNLSHVAPTLESEI